MDFVVVMDNAKVSPAGSVAPWSRFAPPIGTSYASSRHEFDVLF